MRGNGLERHQAPIFAYFDRISAFQNGLGALSFRLSIPATIPKLPPAQRPASPPLSPCATLPLRPGPHGTAWHGGCADG
jgi:hypothetical protein